MKKILTLLFVLSTLITACDSASATPPDVPTVDSVITETPSALTEIPAAETPFVPSEITLGSGYGWRGSWFELYFTNPESSLAPQETGGPDGPLADSIDSARLSVDVAAYSLSLNSIRDALLRAHDRGVQVRMVMESDNLDNYDPQQLKDAGILILGDRREGLMHDKFVVIDNSEVWTGSMNFTDSGTYKDNNNLIRIHSLKIAEDYTKEFEEMFNDDMFGPDIVAETPNPRVKVDDTIIDVYFSPDDKVQDSLLDLIANAQKSIYFMAFSFTSDSLGEAIRAKAEEGIVVAGVMETDQVNSNIGTEFDPFSQSKMLILRDGNEGQMHHKVMIIDESIVVLGSYNFTNSAETRNDENLLVIYSTDIAEQFMTEFQRIYSQAK
jgi:phosphatidylserine/phosphatidylglycerophosphate/cardiolipin synthase-like enzyme